MRRQEIGSVLVALLVTGVAVPAVVSAHGRSLSYSRWRLAEDGAGVELRLARPELHAAGLPSGGPALATYATEHLRLLRGGEACVPGPVQVRDAPGGGVTLDWRVSCSGSGPVALESRLLAEVFSQHLHFARIVGAEGRTSERVLQAADGPVEIAGAHAVAKEASPGVTFGRFVALGIEHIATGWDHLAFVVALVLVAATLGEVVSLTAGFTVAHGVTLALAVTGVIHPDPHAVDAVIGLSVALVAAENVWLLASRPRVVPLAVVAGLLVMASVAALGYGRVDAAVLVGMALFAWCHFQLLARAARPARLRVAVAFAFGLVHGLGFAGILGEMSLAPSRMALALGGFNVGIELGQLAVIAAVWPLMRMASRLDLGRMLGEAGSAALAGLGVFWLVVRAFAR